MMRLTSETGVSKQIANETHDVGVAMDGSTRIVIADDHSMVRHAIRQFVETYRGLKVIGEAGDGAHAVELARELRPHIILMDVHMPVMDGSEAAKAIRRDLPDVKVIGISVDPDMEPLMREAGACACVQKPDLAAELYPALCMAMAGRLLTRRSRMDHVMSVMATSFIVLTMSSAAISGSCQDVGGMVRCSDDVGRDATLQSIDRAMGTHFPYSSPTSYPEALKSHPSDIKPFDLLVYFRPTIVATKYKVTNAATPDDNSRHHEVRHNNSPGKRGRWSV